MLFTVTLSASGSWLRLALFLSCKCWLGSITASETPSLAYTATRLCMFFWCVEIKIICQHTARPRNRELKILNRFLRSLLETQTLQGNKQIDIKGYSKPIMNENTQTEDKMTDIFRERACRRH
ncbi:hypothetical protein VIGAN_11206400 [Vigna angularis var. angularis]|uniref:Secreted protein n=1 Tax=Vigna angularis var. angularis TaxID=157739 RepID=A0A0S3TBX2_PHAAN|nr:uncharacterized protein LOC108320026 [Vigna angularis]BAU02516.1 hypothetical protein VIGAN_11206400 [Vigna angularis var. angularis]